jgi:hypothetical protein
MLTITKVENGFYITIGNKKYIAKDSMNSLFDTIKIAIAEMDEQDKKESRKIELKDNKPQNLTT